MQSSTSGGMNKNKSIMREMYEKKVLVFFSLDFSQFFFFLEGGGHFVF